MVTNSRSPRRSLLCHTIRERPTIFTTFVFFSSSLVNLPYKFSDWFDHSEASKPYLGNNGQRIATVLTYLSTPEAGGETIFPDAKNGALETKALKVCQGKLLFKQQTPFFWFLFLLKRGEKKKRKEKKKEKRTNRNQ